VTVHPGDSLWTIAANRLGPGASQQQIWSEVVAIWRLNAARLGTGDPNLIFPGQRVELPASGGRMSPPQAPAV
jgi:nucleoid-associated protein YgaU